MTQNKPDRRVESVWGKCPISLFESNPTPNEIRVYISLSSFQGQNPDCYPPLEDVAARAKLSISSAKKAAAGLVQKRWIERQRRYGKSNLYRVLIAVEPSADSLETGLTDGPGNSAHEQPSYRAHEQPSYRAIIVKEQIKEHSKTTADPESLREYKDQYFKRFKTLPRITAREHETLSRTIREYNLSQEESVEYIKLWGKQWKESLTFWPATLLKFDGELIARLDKVRALEHDEHEEILEEVRRFYPDYKK